MDADAGFGFVGRVWDVWLADTVVVWSMLNIKTIVSNYTYEAELDHSYKQPEPHFFSLFTS